LLVDVAAGHKVIGFMDGNAGYNQSFMAVEDVAKTAFRCPGHIGLFEWIVMTFGLKNAGATWQDQFCEKIHIKFIAKVVAFFSTVKNKKDQKFVWGDEQQKAFNEIKEYMKEPPVLVPPQLNKPFKL
jgi:hypothetical protein